MRSILFLVFMLLSNASLQAAELADVHFDEKLQLAGAEKPLLLNGLGIRYKFVFKIYIAALYLTETGNQAEAVIASDTPKRMVMHFLYDEVPREKLVNGWDEGFENNLTEQQLNALKPRIDQFKGFFETMKEGEAIYLDYIPGEGTAVIVKGEKKGVVSGHDFNQALLRIWLGEEPIGEKLKQNLLGGE